MGSYQHRSTKATYKLLTILTQKLSTLYRRCRTGLKQHCLKAKLLKTVVSKLKSLYAQMQALDRLEYRLLERKRHHIQLGVKSVSLDYQLEDLQERRVTLIRARNNLVQMLTTQP